MKKCRLSSIEWSTLEEDDVKPYCSPYKPPLSLIQLQPNQFIKPKKSHQITKKTNKSQRKSHSRYSTTKQSQNPLNQFSLPISTTEGCGCINAVCIQRRRKQKHRSKSPKMKLRGDPVGPARHDGIGTRPETDKLDGVTVRWLQYAGLQHLTQEGYRDNDVLWNSDFTDNAASSSVDAPMLRPARFGNGLLDLKSVDDSTGFLSEDVTVGPFDLLPVSPPKGIHNDLNLNVRLKSEVKSNRKTKGSNGTKQSNAKGKNVVKELMVEPFELFPISPPKRAKEKGKNVHKDTRYEVPSSPKTSNNNNNIRKSEKRKDKNAKYKDIATIKDVAVVAEQIDSPAWSPIRGLQRDLNLLRGDESKRNSEGPDSDFDFMRGAERKRRPSNSSSNASARSSLNRKTRKSKEKIRTQDKIMEVKSGPLGPALEPVSNPNYNPNPNKGLGLNNEFDSIMEDLSKWNSTRSARSSSANKKEIIKTADLDNAFSSALDELSKLQSIRSARSSCASKKDFISKENNSNKITFADLVSESIGTIPVSLSSGTNNEFNSAIEELSKWQSTKSARSSSASRKNIISKDEFEFGTIGHLKEASSDRNELNFKKNKMTNVKIVKMIEEQMQVSTPTPKKETKRQFSLKRNNSKEKNSAKIRVVVRKKPLNKKEMFRKEKDILYVDDYEHLTIHEPKLKVDLTAYIEKHEFNFDAVFDEQVNNDEVYNVTVGHLIPSIFEGAKITCFAFGQTGSGKTFTMQPLPVRASRDIIHLLHQNNIQYNQNLKLSVSYFEIYGKKIIDLLNDRRNLCIREDGNQQVCIVGLQEYEISDAQAIQELIQKGNSVRSTGSTGANEESSRSHSILQLAVKLYPTIPPNSPQRKSQSIESEPKTVGKISFIDLAGSERGADSTHNDREKRNEGVEINKSLLALKECIRALDNYQNHVPFRGSKLTEVLRDSFIGDSRTVMICCVSPSAASCEQTLNSLRYAQRVKNLTKGGYSKKEVSSPVSNQIKDIFELENQDQEEEIINDEKDIYGPATEIGETSFRFMPDFYNFRADEEDQVEKNGILGENKTDNIYDICYGSSLDFGTQNSLQVFSKDEDIAELENEALNIDGEIKALIEEESSRLSTFSEEKELDNYDSNFNFMTNHKELLIEAKEEKQNRSNIVSGSNLSPKKQEALYEEGFSSDNGDIKTIVEENDYTFYVHNKESVDIIESEQRKEAHEKLTEQISANDLDLNYEEILNQNQINHQLTEEAALMEMIQSENNKGNTTTVTHKENILRLESNQNFIENEERETQLSPLEIGNKHLQIISSNSFPTNKSEASTQNSLNIAENRRKPNKSPHRRIPREKINKKKGDNLNSQNEEKLSDEKQNKMEGSRKEWPISTLFQAEEALLAAHRKVIQNTMNILREELSMLVEVDQPGSFINNYMTQLSFVLSRKAADLASLQTRVIRFQQCIREQEKNDGRMSFP